MNLESGRIPEDFDAFWHETTAEAMGAPLDCHRTLHNDYELPGFTVERHLPLEALEEELFTVGLPIRRGLADSRALSGLRRTDASRCCPNEYGTRPGFASLSFNFHGEPAYHRESYINARGYFSEGAGEPRNLDL